MGLADDVRKSLLSRKWGNPEWKEVDKIFAADGLVIVPLEDLDIVMNRGDEAVGWPRYSEACNTLRAALPERTENA